MERPRKIVDSTRMASGRPSGLMVRRVGSTFDTGIDIVYYTRNDGVWKGRCNPKRVWQYWSPVFPYIVGRMEKQKERVDQGLQTLFRAEKVNEVR
jgi:hypothetical protein